MKRLKIRTMSVWCMVVAVVVGVFFFAVSYRGSNELQVLEASSEKCLTCEKAAKDLQDGSNYLTEQVRLYTITGERKYLDNYFEEATVTCHRENALAALAEGFDGTHAFDALKAALDCSQELMQTEYQAMRLTLEARAEAPDTWPEVLQGVTLSPADAALAPQEKLLRAQQLVYDDNYQSARITITAQVSECMDSLITLAKNQLGHATSVFTDMYRKLEVGMLVLVALLLFVFTIIHHLVTRPLTQCNQSIRDGKLLPVAGAGELQVMAETYNQVYQENEEAHMLICHKAEHDALTNLLNRGSFDKLLQLYEGGDAPFALILVDVDIFKSVNDVYGHAAGDEVLKRVATLLSAAFRSIDYVFRIGGDEFAVIMAEMTSDLQYTIFKKIHSINETLAQGENGLPKFSISAGAAFSDRPSPAGTLFEDADHALYQCKSSGKADCHVFGED